MATINANELAELRGTAGRNLGAAHWTKAQVNAALQAVEDRLTANATRNAIASDIEAAAPGVFSAQEKATLFGVWCHTAARRLGVN